MRRRYVGLVCSGLWLLLGAAALLAHFGISTTIGEDALIWAGVLFYGISSGAGSRHVTHGLLWDSAHGPPFLTVPGVVIFYLVPGAWGIVNFLRWRARQRGSAT
jgi:hypothetical protein